MLAYLESKEQFLRDAPTIEDVIEKSVRRHLHLSPGPAEVQSWRNSLGNAMSHVMRHPKIPDDAAVAIEYRLNGRKFRIDFLIAGHDPNGHESVVIIELKQWSEVDYSELQGHVRTFVGGRIRDEQHPSYQAWSYASHLQQFNEYVYSEDVRISACAYLHNCQDESIIRSERYENDLGKAPVFIKGEIEDLQGLIQERISHGIGTDVLNRIDNSPIRPSKQLAESVGSMLHGNQEFVLLDEQKTVLETIVSSATKSQVDSRQVLIIRGGPGTGKSVIAINALSRLTALRLNTRYVTPNSAPRNVFETKLKGSLPDAEVKLLFSGSGSYTSTENDSFDVLIVDEAHRLRLRHQYAKGGTNQIAEVIRSSRLAVFFIDEAQKVTWKDIGEIEAIRRFAKAAKADVTEMELSSQFRCSGSDDYMVWLDDVLGVRHDSESYFSRSRFDFRVVEDPSFLMNLIRESNSTNNRSRLVAGYCWDWVSKNDPQRFDIEFPLYDFKARWNLESYGNQWIIHPNSINDVGCIHTCQGLELDVVGVIIGADLIARDGVLKTFPAARARTDKSLHGYKKESKLEPVIAEAKADEIIRNTYRTLMSRGMKGCYIWSVDPETNQFFKDQLPS